MAGHAKTVQPLKPDPLDAPIRALGHRAARYIVLTAQGELRSLTAADLESGRQIFDLFVGGRHHGRPVEEWLLEHFPLKRKRADANADRLDENGGSEWSRRHAGEWIMRACVKVGLYDDTTPVRGVGVWRDGLRSDPAARALIHCGRWLLLPTENAGVEMVRSGVLRGEAIYPACSSGVFPRAPELEDVAAPEASEMSGMLDRTRTMWGWGRPTDPDAWFGWIAVAALGAFPEWRPHMWVNGRRGSGKSELSHLAHALLGPLSPGVYNDFSAAGVRQKENGQARPHLFDEAERQASYPGSLGMVEAVIKMLRNMSGDAGSAAVRGRSDHTAVTFNLYGAGYLSSILPGRLEPQDRSRFIMIGLDPIPSTPNPGEAAHALEELRRDAERIGRGLWRRMLTRSVDYDAAFRLARSFVQRLGGDTRDGATIGAILAGRHLLFNDDPMRPEDLEGVRELALSLIEDAKAATEEGEGELCWNRLLQSTVHLGHGDVRTIGEILHSCISGGQDSRKAAKDLRRLGVYYRRPGARRGQPEALYIVSASHAQLDLIFRGTRWVDGGHKGALLMLEGVARAANPLTIDGQPARALEIPRKYWPVSDDGDDD